MASLNDLNLMPAKAAQNLLFKRLFDHVSSLEPFISADVMVALSIAEQHDARVLPTVGLC